MPQYLCSAFPGFSLSASTADFADRENFPSYTNSLGTLFQSTTLADGNRPVSFPIEFSKFVLTGTFDLMFT